MGTRAVSEIFSDLGSSEDGADIETMKVALLKGGARAIGCAILEVLVRKSYHVRERIIRLSHILKSEKLYDLSQSCCQFKVTAIISTTCSKNT